MSLVHFTNNEMSYIQPLLFTNCVKQISKKLYEIYSRQREFKGKTNNKQR